MLHLVSLQCPFKRQFPPLAANAGPDGHEGPKGASSLHHHLADLRNELPSPEAVPAKKRGCNRKTIFASSLFKADLRAPKPPKMAPDAIPTHMPIMKPIRTRSKQVGPWAEPLGITAGMLRAGRWVVQSVLGSRYLVAAAGNLRGINSFICAFFHTNELLMS